MINRLVIILVCCFLFSCGGTKVYFFGIDMDWAAEAELKDAARLLLGAGVAFASHEVAHMLTEDGTKSEGHAGFLAQTVLATVLTSFEATRYSYFTRGVVAMNDVQIWSYPIRRGDGGDIGLMGDDGRAYWAAYSGVALHNTLRVRW